MNVDNVAYKLVDDGVTPRNVTVELSGTQKYARQADVQTELQDRSAAGDVVSISPVWREVASRIDPRNASPLEMIKLSQTLYDAGVITFEDHINLSFQPEVNADEGDNEAARTTKDFVALWQDKQNTALRQGADRAELEDLQRIQAVLGYIDSIR